MVFFSIYTKNKEFETTCCALFQIFQFFHIRHYSKRWISHIKSTTAKALLINQHKNEGVIQSNSNLSSKRCRIVPCVICKHICHCSNIDGSLTYAYQCLVCDKQYVVETGSSLRVRNNGHRYALLVVHKSQWSLGSRFSICVWLYYNFDRINFSPRFWSTRLYSHIWQEMV